MKAILCTLFVALVALSGCDYDTILNKLAASHTAEIELAKRHLTQIQARDFAEVESKADLNLKSEGLRGILENVASVIPAEKPTDVKLIGLIEGHMNSNGKSSETVAVTFEYQYPDRYLMSQFVFKKTDGATTISGLHVTPLPDSLKNIHKFTLTGKKPINYAILAAACIVPLFTLATLAVWRKTPIPKRRWLWFVFILLGLGTASVNWTDSSLNFNPFAFQILGAAIMRMSPYSPAILSVSFPLGAIVFLIRRRKWLAQTAELTSV